MEMWFFFKAFPSMGCRRGNDSSLFQLSSNRDQRFEKRVSDGQMEKKEPNFVKNLVPTLVLKDVSA